MFESSQLISFNGRITCSDEPVIKTNDQGLLYGYGVFDTLRVYNGIPFLYKKHFDRLCGSGASIGMNTRDLALILENYLYEYIARAELKDCIVRTSLTYGHDGLSNIILTSRKLPYSDEKYEQGFSATVSDIRRNQLSPLSKIKTLNYLDNILSRKAAAKAGFDESIMLNCDDVISECSMSNIFFVKENIFYTPSIEAGALCGITMGIIKELLAIRGENLIEGDFTIDELLMSDEAFVTNSAIEVMPLVSVDKNFIGNGKPGNSAKLALSFYRNFVNKYIIDNQTI